MFDMQLPVLPILAVNLVLAAAALAFWIQTRHTRRELSNIMAQERHLYRMLQEQMQDLEELRVVQHDARNQLTMLQGFLERGETDQALAYVQSLTDDADALDDIGTPEE